MKESIYKGKLDRCEVESVVAPLRDKEPTPAWMKHFKDSLKHYDVTLKSLQHLTAISNKLNLLGRRYGEQSLQSLLAHYKDKRNDWTKNGFKTINDHLDVLVDYLSKPNDLFEAAAETLNDTIAKASEFISENQTTSLKDNLESTTMSLRERLEKERAEGKWPSVDERIKEQENNLVKVPENLYVIDTDNQSEGSHLHYNYDGDVSKLVDTVDIPHKVHIKRVKKHKKHRKSNNIYITIKIGR